MPQNPKQNLREVTIPRGASIAVGATIGIVVLTVVFGSWYTIDQTQRGALLRNGAFVEAVLPGLHFKLPWVENIYKVDMQTHTKTWDKMESYSSDQQPAHLRVSVTLHVAADKIEDLYSRFGGDIEAAITRVIAPHVFAETKNVFGQYTAARAISDRVKLNAATSAALAAAIAYDPVFGIESVQIEDISFSGDYIKSVEARMQAEVEVQKLQQNLAREKVQADIAVTQANGRAQSVVAEAKARADAIRLTGEAEGAAIEARSKALEKNQNVIALTQAERWDGKLPATMIPGSTVPFLTVK